MRQVLLMLFVVLFVFAGASPQELSSEEETLFAQGVSAGMMSKHEGNVVDAFNGLLTLQKLAGTEQYRSLLVTKMNTAFFAMSFVDRDVTIRPETLKILARMTSANMREFMVRVRQARIDSKWQSPDPKQEERIGWVLDRYAKTGNVYGFE